MTQPTLNSVTARTHRSARAGKRGIILVFVVVLLSLLAIMGTAYLAVSRADRQTITSSGQLPNQLAPPRVRDRATLDRLFAAAQQRVNNTLIEDMFNVKPGSLGSGRTNSSPRDTKTHDPQAEPATAFERFRQEYHEGSTLYYHNYDAPGRADPWLSSLLPEFNPNIGGGTVVWPWIGRPLVGPMGGDFQVANFFSDPRVLNTANGFTARIADTTNTAGVGGSTFNPGLDVLDRRNLPPTSFEMLRNDWQVPAGQTGDLANTRVYPALQLSGGRGTMIAADADGDGIADSGLAPVILNPNAVGLDQYLDRQNGVVYFVSYRVVDNSAQLNVNTALSVTGDYGTIDATNLTSESVSANAELRNRIVKQAGRANLPTFGFFKSNVGLMELIRPTLTPYGDDVTGSNTAGANLPVFREGFRFVDARFPQLKETPADTSPFAANVMTLMGLPGEGGGTVRIYRRKGSRNAVDTAAIPDDSYVYRSFGDLLEQQVARHRTDVPVPGVVVSANVSGSPNYVVQPAAIKRLSINDSVSWATKSGTLRSDRHTPDEGENALSFTTQFAAPNFSASEEPAWQWFPPDQVDVWFQWTKSFSNFDTGGTVAGTLHNVPLLDLPNGNAGDFTETFNYSFGAGTGMASTNLPRPLRSILTTRNGTTAQVPMRGTIVGNKVDPPAGMPGYGPIGPNTYPAIRVSAATGTKEQLWRAYWSSMTHNNGNGWSADRKYLPPLTSGGTPRAPLAYEAFKAPDRHASSTALVPLGGTETRLGEGYMTLIRSAVAACNTIDMRDPDNDLTAMTILLGPSDTATPTSDPLYARVYGTEKQLVITGVVVDDSDGVGTPSGAPYIAVEIYNPSNEPIDLRAYYLNVVARPTGAGLSISNPTVKSQSAPGYGPPISTGPGSAASPHLSDLDPPAPAAGPQDQIWLQPGGFLVITSAAAPPAAPTGINIEAARPDLDYTDPTTEMPPIPLPQVLRKTMPDLVSAIGLDRELVLLRTRRADGEPYTDPAGVAVAFDESVASVPDLTSLAPVDAVDMRSLDYTAAVAQRYWYLRSTVNVSLNRTATATTPPNPDAWKCFYAGKFYELREPPDQRPNSPRPPTQADTPPVPTAVTPIDGAKAWRGYDANAAPGSRREIADAGGTLGAYRNDRDTGDTPGGGDDVGTSGLNDTPAGRRVAPFLAPTIQIQNFTPFYYESYLAAPPPLIEHKPNQFPFGSPFARDGDLLTVPFIGSYSVWRVSGPGPAGRQMYEYVPLTMDAWACAPDPDLTDPYAPPGSVTVNTANEDAFVGRFFTNAYLPAASGYAGRNPYSNEWAADLFDFVSARQQAAAVQFPDVPRVDVPPTAGGILINNPTVPYSDQDGPVQSAGSAVNMFLRVPWVQWSRLSTGTPAPLEYATRASRQIGSSSGVATGIGSAGSQLIEGTVNINTAPVPVLRMLPWTVELAPWPHPVDSSPMPAGTVNQLATSGPPLLFYASKVANAVRDPNKTGNYAYAIGDSPGRQLEPEVNGAGQPLEYGFRSAMSLLEVGELGETDQKIINADAEQIRYLGHLSGEFRPPALNDFVARGLNMSRVSNLVSGRSDVFTVYITVQAWTWTGDNNTQGSNTRLVGERRGSYIVDRSRISATNCNTEDLIIFPIETE